MRYSDEHIEYFGKIFVESHGYASGITFEYFMTDPWSWIDAWNTRYDVLNATDGYLPLLIEQANVQRRVLMNELDGNETELMTSHGHPVEMHGSRLIESLRNNVKPKAWKTHTRRAVQ